MEFHLRTYDPCFSRYGRSKQIIPGLTSNYTRCLRKWYKTSWIEQMGMSLSFTQCKSNSTGVPLANKRSFKYNFRSAWRTQLGTSSILSMDRIWSEWLRRETLNLLVFRINRRDKWRRIKANSLGKRNRITELYILMGLDYKSDNPLIF